MNRDICRNRGRRSPDRIEVYDCTVRRAQVHNTCLIRKVNGRATLRSRPARKLIARTRERIVVEVSRNIVSVLRIRHRTACIRRILVVAHRVAVRCIDRMDGLIARNRCSKDVGCMTRIVVLLPVVKVIARLVIRAIRLRGRRVVRHRRIGDHLVLMRRICIRPIGHGNGVAVGGPSCIEGDIARDRRVLKVICRSRRIALLIPMTEGMARKIARRGTLTRLGLRSACKVAVFHGLRARRHIAALRIEADRVARQRIAVIEVQSAGKRCIAAAALFDFLHHRKCCAALRDLVVQGVDLGGAAVAIACSRTRKLREFIVVITREREGQEAACHRSGRRRSECAVAESRAGQRVIRCLRARCRTCRHREQRKSRCVGLLRRQTEAEGIRHNRRILSVWQRSDVSGERLPNTEGLCCRGSLSPNRIELHHTVVLGRQVNDTLLVRIGDGSCRRGSPAGELIPRTRVAVSVQILRDTVGMRGIRNRAARIRSVLVVLNRILIRCVGRSDRRILRDRGAEGVGIAVLIHPAVEMVTGLVVRCRRRRYRAAVIHARIVQILKVLLARVSIVRLFDNDMILIDIPLRLEGLIPRNRRVEVVGSTGCRVNPTAEMIASLLSRRRTVTCCGRRSTCLIAVLHSLCARRHIAAVRIEAHRVLRTLIAVREVKRSVECRKGTAVHTELLGHHELGEVLYDRVLDSVDLAVVAVTVRCSGKLTHFINVLTRHCEVKGTARYGTVTLSRLRIRHALYQV